ncbi:hypothetical protein VM98_38110, partial [Streptomyces rubellomurinus subsp. indigoferus]
LELAAAAAPVEQAPGGAGADEPIAIVGMACVRPGGFTTPEELSRLLAAYGYAVSGVPPERGWDLSGIHGPGGRVREGGVVADVDRFDAAVFGIGPREPVGMHPQ